MIILATPQAKFNAIYLLQEALKQFMNDTITPTERQAVDEHINWLKSQPGRLFTHCRLEVHPETKRTRLYLELDYTQNRFANNSP